MSISLKKSLFYRTLFSISVFLLGFAPLLYLAQYFDKLDYFIIAFVIATLLIAVVFLFFNQWERILKKSFKVVVLKYLNQNKQAKTFNGVGQNNEASDEYEEKCRAYELTIQQLSEQLQEEQRSTKDGWEDEREQYESHIDNLKKELESELKKFDEKQKRYETKHKEAINLLQDQRNLLEQRHKKIMFLEKKVRDLSYEVKALLQIGEMENAPFIFNEDRNSISNPAIGVFHSKTMPEIKVDNANVKLPVSSEPYIKTPYDAGVLLQKVIAAAERFTGSQNFNRSKYSELAVKSNKVDKQRLWSSFQNEIKAIIIYYSKEEHKVVFANNQVKKVLGWNSDKFISLFSEVILKDGKDWENIINRLCNAKEDGARNGYQTRLLMNNVNGEPLLIHASLGRIHQGIFSGNIIAVLYRMV